MTKLCQLLTVERIELLSTTDVEYNDILDLYGSNDLSWKQDNIATIAIFRMQGNITTLAELILSESSEQFWVVNTHLYWDPKMPHLKLLQIHHCLTQLKRVLEKNHMTVPTCPGFLCGDFNSMPNSDVYQYVNRTPLEFTKTAIWRREKSISTNFRCWAFRNPIRFLIPSI